MSHPKTSSGAFAQCSLGKILQGEEVDGARDKICHAASVAALHSAAQVSEGKG